ncbi:MAG: hypothetical protein ACKV2T_12690 [Kofleriaceae bacterium]
MRNLLVLFVVLFAFGCKDKSAKEAEDDDPALSFVADGAKEGVEKIKAAIAAGKPGDAIFKCAHTANIDTLKNSKPHAALAAELEQLCNVDLPLAMITKGVEEAETARKAKPDDKVLSECFNAYMSTAYDEMKKAKTEAKAKDALARFAVVCPEQAGDFK